MPTVQVVSDFSEFMALEGEWNELASKFSTPLLRHEWFTACWNAFDENSELSVFVVRHNGAIRAIAPIVIDRSGVLARLCALGYQTTEPTGFLYADKESLRMVCAATLNRGLPVALPRIGPNETEQFRGSSDMTGLLVIRPDTTATARARLQPDWEIFQAKMPAKSRATIRKRRKAAEGEGLVTFKVVSPEETTVEYHLSELFRVEAAGWKGRTGTAIVNDHRMKLFYTQLGRAAAKLRILRMFFLKIGDSKVAAQMAVEYANRLWGLKIGYDEHWSSCAPGILMQHETLRYACDRGLNAFEFLGGAETWQRRWPIELDSYSTLRFYPRSIKGSLALGYDTCAFVARRVSRIIHRDSRFLTTSQY